MEAHRVHSSLDPIGDVEAQRTGPGEVSGCDPMLTREPCGEPLIAVRLPTGKLTLVFPAGREPGGGEGC